MSECRAFEAGLYKFLDDRHPGTLAAIAEKKKLDDGLTKELSQAITNFKEEFKSSKEESAA